jgi:hypothetical protein
MNKQKIILMTKLALYDKNEGETDKKTNDFYRHDYLYRMNMGIRLSVGLGGLLLVALYWLYLLFIDGMDILTADLRLIAYESGMFLVALIAVYSLIGTIQGTRQYYLVQKRINNYLSMLRQLERIESRARRKESAVETESDRDKNDGRDALLYKKPRPRYRSDEGKH